MIGSKIQEIRIKKKMTLTELAERAKISKSYLSNIERNLNQNPSIHIIKKIAEVLNVELNTLLTKDEETEGTNDLEWIEFVQELRDIGIEKHRVQEFRTLIEFIKWKNEQTGEKE